jgi:hypothetical protein
MTAQRPDRKGQIPYLKEGFIVHWDEELLTIEVIDYHATVLRLAWKDVQALAKVATGGSPPGVSPPRGQRKPRREV